jgi:hypothetical protein
MRDKERETARKNENPMLLVGLPLLHRAARKFKRGAAG